MGNFCDDIQENVILMVFLEGGGGGGRSGLSFGLDLQPLFHEFLMSLLSIVIESTLQRPRKTSNTILVNKPCKLLS